VRIINRRERWAKCTLATALGMPVLYVASFGPACWITSRANIRSSALSGFYYPITSAMWWTGNWAAGPILDEYSRMYAAPNWTWMRVDTSHGERYYIWVEYKI